MARLTRQTLAVFAGSASNQGTFGSAQAGSPATSSSPTTVQSLAAWTAGWLDAVIGGQKLPPLEEFQGVQFVHSYMTAYLMQEGIPEYDAGTTYYQYSVVKKPSTFQLYGYINASGSAGNALTNATYWQLLVDLSNVPGVEAAYGVTTNSTNAYSVTTSPAVTVLATGQIFNLQINAANTGAATLNVGGVGAIAIVDRGGSALVGGEMIASRTYPFVYNGTNFNILTSLFPESSYGVTTNSSNTYSVTTTPAFGILKTGQVLNLQLNAANTGSLTINPNSIGAKTVHDVDGNTLQSGHIVAGRDYSFFYDGTYLVCLAPYPGIRQNSQSAAYTTVMADNGGHILHPTADNNPRTFTIDSNANVAYPIGASITFYNQINTVTIAITSDTLTQAGTGSTGSRTLAAYGIATAMKVAATSWVISGTGLT